MIINFAKIYITEGTLETAVFTKEDLVANTNSITPPRATVDVVDKPRFGNTKKTGAGQIDLGTMSFGGGVDTLADATKLAQIGAWKVARTPIVVGIVLDDNIETLNIKVEGYITEGGELNDITPGSDADYGVTVKVESLPVPFVEPVTGE